VRDHRHLDYPLGTPVDQLGRATLDDLLDRGDLADWAPLAREIRLDPHGTLAETVLMLCAAHPMYGTSKLWHTWIMSLRQPGPRQQPEGDGPGVRLAELRSRRGLTQSAVGDRLRISQSDVSKLERRGDIRVSTVHRYVQATGGRLRLVCAYPDGTELILRIDGGTDLA
jgi:Helix-turn-helix domain